MARLAIEKETYRALLAKTGNQCAFPGCTHPLVDEDNEFVAQICHIEAAGKGGERYNPAMTDDERRSVENLLVLCHRHHVKTNNTDIYTVAHLRKMKADHENQWAERPYRLPNQALEQIFEEQILFEKDVTAVNTAWLGQFDLAMDLRFSEDPAMHLAEVSAQLARIEQLLDDLAEFLHNLPDNIGAFLEDIGYDSTKFREVHYYENPFHEAFWLMMNVGKPNVFNSIQFHLTALEVHIEFQKARARPNDSSIRARLHELQSQLSKLAQTLAHVD